MEQTEKKEIKEVISCLDIYLGSIQKVKLSVLGQRISNADDGIGNQYEYIVFDFTNKIPSELASTLLTKILEIDRDKFISAHAPTDRLSLTKAEEDGFMYMLDKGWLKDPAIFQDNGGGGGCPRVGNALVAFNESKIREKLIKTIRRLLDHVRHNEFAVKGITESTTNSRIVIRIHFSAVGAIGSGGVHKLINGLVRDCAAEAGAEAKIVLCMLLKGNFSVQNIKKATLNELTTLRILRPKSTGTYVNPLTGMIEQVPFDILYISSNINNEGNITSLDRLLCHEGQINYFTDYTPGGNSLRERSCDLENLVYSNNGDPECGLSRGMAIISRNSYRILAYLSYRTSAILARSCLEESDYQEIIEQVAAHVRIIEIVENEDENLITKSILTADGFGGENARERALASFADRTGRSSGFDGLQVLLDTIHSIANTDLNTGYEPLMKDEAVQHFNTAIDQISKNLEQLVRKPNGLWQTQQVLQSYKLVLEKASQCISEKINELQEHLQPHEDIIAEISDNIQQLKQMNFIGRALQFFTKRSMAETLEGSGRSLINYSVELSACKIALQDVVLPLLDEIDNKLGWILAEIEKLNKIEQFCNNEAEQIVNQPTIFQAPVGLEMTDRQFLENKFSEYIEKAGGIERFQHELRLSFLNKHSSFAVLFQASMSEIIDMFYDFCASKYRSDIDERDVLDELFQKDKKTLHELFARIIPQSDGRVRVDGQANEYVPRIKVASVPSEKHVAVVTEFLESLDSNPGKWQVVVNSADRDTFSLVQVRGQISLTQFIDRIDLPDTYENWKILIETAVDPLSVIMVGPNPNDRQVKRIMAKGIVCGLLTEDKKQFSLKTYTGDSDLLGDLNSTLKALQSRFRDTVFIESTFGRDLVVDEDKVMTKLKTMFSDLTKAEDQQGSLLTLIDTTAVQECLDQAELLLSRLRRMRKYNPRQIA